MAISIKGLNDQEIAVLQKLIDLHKGLLTNTSSRPPTERSWDEAEDHQAPEVYVAKPQEIEGILGITRAEGTAAGDYDIPGKGVCDIYRIQETVLDLPEAVPIEGLQKTVYNLGDPLPQELLAVIRTKGGPWLAIPVGMSFVGFELAEDHPGRSTPFSIRLGQWSSAGLTWEPYDKGDATAIDHRYGVPYPLECATGLGMWMPADDLSTGTGTGTASSVENRIVEVWALDCESPGCPGS